MNTIADSSNTPRPSMKGRRTSKTSDDDDSKKRGRPRVEKNDESAADRRRTQIRMAQRAYRQRKESTLEELRKRVNELTGTVNTMEAIFQDSMQRLISTGLPHAAENELRMTAARLAGLKTSSQAKESDLSDDAMAERQISEPVLPPTIQQQSEDTLTPKNVSIWLDQTEVSRRAQKPQIDDYLGLGYSIVPPESSQDPSLFPLRTQHGKRKLDAPKQPAGAMSTHDENPLLLRTFSFHETSFARRVHRACLEAGLSLLLDPSRNVRTYERVYRLPLLARDRMELITCTKTVLRRGITESLELYEAPMIHIGGAGTHYARRDKHGNLVQPRPAYNLGLVGPETLKLLMHADSQRLTADMAVAIHGFEGSWFDPYDVEGYLEDQGIAIEPAASFVEVEVPADMRALGDSASISSRAGTPGLSQASSAPTPRESLDAFDLNSMPWDNPFPAVTIDGPTTYTNTESWMDPVQPVRQDSAKPKGAKKTVIIDVAKLIKGLMLCAVCLGQTPGFRRSDVDKALAYACFNL